MKSKNFKLKAWFINNKVYWITWIVSLSVAIFWALTRIEKYEQVYLAFYLIKIFLLYMGLPFVIFSSVIITLVKYRKHWKKLLVIYFGIGLSLYLITSSIWFVSLMKKYDYSINCLNLLEGKSHNLKSHDYSSCSAYERVEGLHKQNYINYLTKKKEAGLGGVIFQSFLSYSLIIIPLWPLGILYPIMLLFIPT